MTENARSPVWTWAAPIAGLSLVAAAMWSGFDGNFFNSASMTALAILIAPALAACVFASVYHADAVAHRTGEPLGTLVLTIAVTIIELALIVSLMFTGKASPTLVRDTVFAVIMIITTGLVGACILAGGLRYREQTFDLTSAKIYLATLFVLASLTLILPNYTQAVPGPLYSPVQLAFISALTILLYGVFLYTQTVLHRGYFGGGQSGEKMQNAGGLVRNVLLLLFALVSVVVLAKLFASVITVAVEALKLPAPVTGVAVALIVLLPESIAAIKSARQDNLQKSLNLALGSSLATIGLTIPAIAAAEFVLREPLILGLENRDMALLLTTLATSILSFGTGRTNVLFGFLHLVLFATFLFLVFVP